MMKLNDHQPKFHKKRENLEKKIVLEFVDISTDRQTQDRIYIDHERAN